MTQQHLPAKGSDLEELRERVKTAHCRVQEAAEELHQAMQALVDLGVAVDIAKTKGKSKPVVVRFRSQKGDSK